MMTRRDPWVNMLRTTARLLRRRRRRRGRGDRAAVRRRDRPAGRVRPPDRPQHPVDPVEESKVAGVIDPAGGSWYVERHTDELARAGWAVFTELERAGGHRGGAGQRAGRRAARGHPHGPHRAVRHRRGVDHRRDRVPERGREAADPQARTRPCRPAGCRGCATREPFEASDGGAAHDPRLLRRRAGRAADAAPAADWHAARAGGHGQGRRRAHLGDARGHRRETLVHQGGHRRARLPRHVPGHRAVPARAVPDDVRQPAVDDPPVRRVLHRRGVERLLPPQHRGRPEGPVGRVRPRHPPRLRLRPPARGRRRRHGRAWPSTRSTTCGSSSTASRWTRCRCR